MIYPRHNQCGQCANFHMVGTESIKSWQCVVESRQGTSRTLTKKAIINFLTVRTKSWWRLLMQIHNPDSFPQRWHSLFFNSKGIVPHYRSNGRPKVSSRRSGRFYTEVWGMWCTLRLKGDVPQCRCWAPSGGARISPVSSSQTGKGNHNTLHEKTDISLVSLCSQKVRRVMPSLSSLHGSVNCPSVVKMWSETTCLIHTYGGIQRLFTELFTAGSTEYLGKIVVWAALFPVFRMPFARIKVHIEINARMLLFYKPYAQTIVKRRKKCGAGPGHPEIARDTLYESY